MEEFKNTTSNSSSLFEKNKMLSPKNSNKLTLSPKLPKRFSLVLDPVDDRQKDNLSSDTENCSPAIGPKDNSSVRNRMS